MENNKRKIKWAGERRNRKKESNKYTHSNSPNIPRDFEKYMIKISDARNIV